MYLRRALAGLLTTAPCKLVMQACGRQADFTLHEWRGEQIGIDCQKNWT
jgi:hypothetical protein